MTRLSVLATFAVLAVVSTQISGQFFNGGNNFPQQMFGQRPMGQAPMGQPQMAQQPMNNWNPSQGNGWSQVANGFNPRNLMGRQNTRRSRFQTCIGKNTNGDEMRITLTIRSRRFPWLNPFESRISDNFVRLYVDYKSPASTLQGQYQLVVTEFSRVEDGCSSQAMGDIISQPVWWGATPTPRGILGNPVTIVRGQNAMASEIIENLSFEDFSGRGIAMCPAHQVSGTRCMDTIPLCCKVGIDQQSASRAVRPTRQMFGMQQGMGMGMRANPGMPLNNGMNPQMGNQINNGMGTGMNIGTNPTGTNQMGNTLAQTGGGGNLF